MNYGKTVMSLFSTRIQVSAPSLKRAPLELAFVNNYPCPNKRPHCVSTFISTNAVIPLSAPILLQCQHCLNTCILRSVVVHLYLFSYQKVL